MTYHTPDGPLLAKPVERITPKSRWLRELELRQTEAAKERDEKVTPIRRREQS